MLIFLTVRIAWQVIMQCIDFVFLYKVTSFAQFLTLALSNFAALNSMSQLIVPSVQAIIVDGSMLYAVILMLQKTGRIRYPSRRRLLRIVLLITTCVLLLVSKSIATRSDLTYQSLISGGIVIVMALGAYVNIDLYMLDLSLFQDRTSDLNMQDLS